MAATDKDTIYIDIDDEITGIIDKLRASDGKIVALVLPKRASVFQSIVNMKLLKRASDDANKHLVLITAEAGLLPLAGAAGVHVAKTLTSKPEIPGAPVAPLAADDAIEEIADDEPDEINLAEAADEPVGKLAGLAPAAKGADGVETLELDNSDPEPAAAAGAAAAAAAAKKPKKDKKLAVPNFERFRLILIIAAAALILLIILFLIANSVLAKATINIQTDATSVNADLNVNLSTTASAPDLSNNTIPAKQAKEQKTYTQQVATTGQQNNGNKAQGNITVSGGACSFNIPGNVPSGTGVSMSGQTFITQDDISFVPVSSHGKCIFQGQNSNGQSGIPIIAQKGGASYNVSGSVSVSGRSDVSGSGSASGGTDNIVQTVSQSDISSAKSKISTDDANIKQTLQNDLSQSNYYAIAATYSAGTPTTTTSANVGDAANNVTVTENVTYTMFGARQSDLKTLVDNSVKDQIDTAKQKILDEGLGGAVFNVNSATADGAQLAMHTSATAGPELNTDQIKQETAGKKSGQVVSSLQQDPDVTGVNVKLSPFWVSSVPKNTSKITINIAKPKPAASSSNANH